MKKPLLLLILVLCTTISYSQTEKEKADHYLKERGELAFTFVANNLEEARELSLLVSFDHGQDRSNPLVINAIANQKNFEKFLAFNLPYTVDKKLNEPKDVVMFDPKIHKKGTSAENLAYPYPLSFPLVAYPTYQQYEDQMIAFATEHPEIAQLVDIGGTVQGVGGGDKRLLFIKLSDNISTREREPRVMYTSSMHGDEVAGFPTMLSLIDYLINAYKNIDENGDPLGSPHPDHSRVLDLLDNSEVWINPMANPDATYWNDNSNTSVAGSRRENASGVDLNRNYPDNVYPTGNHPTWSSYEIETQNFMQLADDYHFVLSANLHGGVELVNYPFDNAFATSAVSHPEDPSGVGPFYTHPDTDWYEYISVEYATHAQNDSDALGLNTYMTVDYDSYIYPSPGVTHGAEWYQVYGGRQDYMNFYQHCKEVTLELSDVKTPPGTDTPGNENEIIDIWYYNKNAYIDYLMQGTYGFQGLVKDVNTGDPIKAKITLVGHDDYGSWVETELPLGDYYRPIDAGTYDILYEADCYQSFTLTNQTITDYQTVNLADVLLTPLSPSVPNNLSVSNITTTTATLNWEVANSGTSYDVRYRANGSSTWITTNTSSTSLDINTLTINTEYEFQVRSYCDALASSYTPSTLFSTLSVSYCNSNGTSNTVTGITSVSFNSLFNEDLDNTNNNGYDDFTGMSTTVIQNSTHPLAIKVNTNGNKSVHAFVWIDFNGDGDFNDANETYDMGDVKNVSNGAPDNSPINITIPSNAVIGSTRMRVSAKFNGNPTSCETGFNGEVEDYTIIVDNVLNTEGALEIENSISVYPNPVKEIIYINTTSNINLLDYKLSNTIGQVVLLNEFTNNKNIDVSLLTNGVYFLSLNTDKGKLVKKIIIN
jgi:hypothetical protein